MAAFWHDHHTSRVIDWKNRQSQGIEMTWRDRLSFGDKKQGKKWRPRGPQPVSDIVSDILDPVMQQRAGMTMQLVMAWEDIVGPNHADYTRPEKLEWPRAYSDDEPFQPATLKIACDGARSIYVQHEAGQIVDRVNTFFGFYAVDRVRIVQKPVQSTAKPCRKKPAPLDQRQKQRLADLLNSVEDENLRNALQKMGEGVFSSGSG